MYWLNTNATDINHCLKDNIIALTWHPLRNLLIFSWRKVVLAFVQLCFASMSRQIWKTGLRYLPSNAAVIKAFVSRHVWRLNFVLYCSLALTFYSVAQNSDHMHDYTHVFVEDLSRNPVVISVQIIKYSFYEFDYYPFIHPSIFPSFFVSTSRPPVLQSVTLHLFMLCFSQFAFCLTKMTKIR